MSSPDVHHLFHAPIADHSFSGDQKTVAVARDNNVELFNMSGKLQDELRGHDKTITGVDIAPNSGRIVTCSQGKLDKMHNNASALNVSPDRNAYVWESTSTGWKPTLVLLRLNRAATCVRWSPSEAKFAVGSGARAIAVCYFESENDWWVSKHLKKPIRSTVTSIAWHPNSVLLAGGSTDGHARVFSAFVKGIDERPEPTVWGERVPFGTVCGEFLNNTAGWVHGCSFAPSGDALAFVAHDSSITIVYPSGPEQPPQAVISVATHFLPFTSLIWASESQIVAAGYDCEPHKFEGSVSGWTHAGTLDASAKATNGGIKEESALNMFRQMDLKGKSAGSRDDTKLQTVHQNTISTVRVFARSGGKVSKFSTSGVDGRVVVWKV
jgi:actin related protein 2/3 complex subunit 1A/1B